MNLVRSTIKSCSVPFYIFLPNEKFKAVPRYIYMVLSATPVLIRQTNKQWETVRRFLYQLKGKKKKKNLSGKRKLPHEIKTVAKISPRQYSKEYLTVNW